MGEEGAVCVSKVGVCVVFASSLFKAGTKRVACEDKQILLDAGTRTGADLVRTRELRVWALEIGELVCELLAVRLQVAREVRIEG